MITIRFVISDDVTTERCTNWFLIKPDAVLTPDSLHTHEWKCASYLQLLLVCRPQRCLLSTLVKHQSCRTEVTQQVIVTHAEIAASQQGVIASACPGVVNGQSFLKFCSLYSLSIFQVVSYCLSWWSLKALSPGKNPVPPPMAPGLIPAPAGTYTPGSQDGESDRSETATLNKSDPPMLQPF